MKKVISILCILVIVVGLVAAFAGCKTDRSEVLKLYVPGEYIDEDIFEEFETWYEEQTGNTVKVEVETFETVENVQRAIEGSKADYDLICPSDYMVEYLIAHDLLLEVDKDVIDITADGIFKSQYLDTTRVFDPEVKYSVPYMYGTLGITYDYSKTGRKLDSWEDLFGSEFAGENTRSIKKSMRDAYVAACLYNNRETLVTKSGAELKAAVQSIHEDVTQDTINAAKTTLSAAKTGSVWDIDQVKFEMATNDSDVKVALMWSCDAGYVMNTYEDEEGNEKEGNKNLWYVVPKEGGNIYMDVFCIGKYAVNITAANYFLKFLCTKEVAIKNSEYAGSISPVAAAYDELYELYSTDEEMFEGTEEGWKEMFLDMMFPSEATLNRCGIMRDLPSEGKSNLVSMWSNIVA